MEEKIKYLLNKILENQDEPLKVEYIANKLKEYLVSQEDVTKFTEVLKKYDQEQLNAALKQSSKVYNIRLRKILGLELIYFLVAISISILGFKYIKLENVDLNIRVLLSITFVLIYIIFRSGKIKKIVKEKSNEEYEENLSAYFRKEIDDRLNK